MKHPSPSTLAAREEIFALLRQSLSEKTDNRPEEIRENSLLFSELNLTEYDLARIVMEVGKNLELDTQELGEIIADREHHELETVADVVDLILDEKELG